MDALLLAVVVVTVAEVSEADPKRPTTNNKPGVNEHYRLFIFDTHVQLVAYLDQEKAN